MANGFGFDPNALALAANGVPPGLSLEPEEEPFELGPIRTTGSVIVPDNPATLPPDAALGGLAAQSLQQPAPVPAPQLPGQALPQVAPSPQDPLAPQTGGGLVDAGVGGAIVADPQEQAALQEAGKKKLSSQQLLALARVLPQTGSQIGALFDRLFGNQR